MTSLPPRAIRRFGRQALTCSLLAGALAWLPPDGRDDSAGLIGAAYAAGPAAGERGAVTPAAGAPGDGIDIGSVFDIAGLAQEINIDK